MECQLTHRLGGGSFGQVFRFKRSDVLSAQEVVKVVRVESKEVDGEIAVFQEASKEGHPNIARLIWSWQRGNLRFLVMERLDGDLGDIVDRQELNLDEAHFVFSQLLRGLMHIHGKGIVHRDLKPANILVKSVDPDFAAGRKIPVKITDFGLSTNQFTSCATSCVGTNAFMAPEVAATAYYGGRYSEEVDVFSLGATLFFALTQQYLDRPYPQQTKMPDSFRNELLSKSKPLVQLLDNMLMATPCDRWSLAKCAECAWAKDVKYVKSFSRRFKHT